MNHLKTNPIGLDAVINEAMVSLYTLSTDWGVTLEGYPRCYPKYTEKGKTLEWYKGNNEYENVIYAEKNKFFFDAENEIVQIGNGYFTTTISLYFIVNLEQVKASIPHRADAEVWSDVMNKLISVTAFGQAERIVTRIDKVFERYDSAQPDDLQPYHCFRIDIPVLEFKLDQPEKCIIN